ncbi:MAG TPA: TraR/DksA C4-type zinc finger protein [Thermodesulfobacteriota bacterium]|nr:TraR/DksA C4-type zinc finger protein [Thermodesulfobacteriota bacterium]HQO78684.1 TraR/DksA C4-type zinc finger protein [Thermodesulfobacteriota bacterium]
MTVVSDPSPFKEKLLKRRGEILSSRDRLHDARQDLQQPAVEMEEAAQKEHLSQPIGLLDNQEERELQDINSALGKIEIGTYGICEYCGEEIAPERLEALPWARYCIEDAEKLEREVRLSAEEA